MNQQPITKRDFNPDGRLWVHSIFGPTIQGEGPFAGSRCVFIRLQDCNLQCPGCDTMYHAPWGNRTDVQKKHWKPQELITAALSLFGETATNPATRDLVVISGGEPFRQNLIPLLLKFRNYFGTFVQIETNGTLPPQFPSPEDFEDTGFEGSIRDRFYNTNPSQRTGTYIVCSPKTPVAHKDFDAVACAFKYVLDHRSVDPEDGLPIHVLGNVNKKPVYRQKYRVRPIYVQPMDHTEEFLGPQWDGVSTNPIGERDKHNHKSLEAAKASCLKHGYILQLQLHKLINVE